MVVLRALGALALLCLSACNDAHSNAGAFSFPTAQHARGRWHSVLLLADTPVLFAVLDRAQAMALREAKAFAESRLREVRHLSYAHLPCNFSVGSCHAHITRTPACTLPRRLDARAFGQG